ncbi:MAG TPA: YtxH domain-containing protein [Bryobacteraceae bacterium]|nr:YtxH domain-containing protein [Bryobacteraceae bacterium]
MESENGRVSAGLGWFVFGAVVGVSAAILLAPERGVNTRRRLAQQAGQGGKNILQTSQDIFERGRELFERGREIAQEASEMFEHGRKIAERNFEERL